jgi:hypothetical protein
MRHLFIGSILALTLLSCGDTKPTAMDDELDKELSSSMEEGTNDQAISDSLIQTLNSIPSPIETAFQIQENGGDYNKSFLNSVENQENYSTTPVQALNLGIYSADLAYINIYKSNDVIEYLTAVSRISQDLGIGKFFDLQSMSQLVKHDDNLDSLLQVTTDNFEMINKHLQQQEQSHLSVLMLTGGWLEGLHLINSVYLEKPSEALKERIGEQKIVLSQLVSLVSHFKEKDPIIKELYIKLEELNNLFEEVRIERTESDEVEIVIIDGLRMAVPKSTSQIIISDEQINQIIALVNSTRSFITE